MNKKWQHQLEKLRKIVQKEIQNLPSSHKLPLFYEPIHYVNTIPGKKIRPLLTIICGMSVGGNLNNLIHPAAAIELLHNFTLVHDDIMDNDDSRRGHPTIHVKWDIGTAILAGDGLIGLAYQKLLNTEGKDTLKIVKLFTEAIIDICEGQALDKTFETKDDVRENEYLEMISKKTATLIKLACQIGAIIGRGNANQVKALTLYGYNIGMGFQVQDDLLDVIADEKKLGKKVGSDLQMNKKTILSIKLNDKIKKMMISRTHIDDYRKLIRENGIAEEVKNIMNQYFAKAYDSLKMIPDNQYKDMLMHLTEYIKNRDK
jgi:geranylgeranyl diphosphate synthase type II